MEPSTSRRMGLFVVGRLARRHGVRVLLHSGEELGGVRATITLPAALLQPESEAQHAGPADEWRPSPPRQKVLNGGHRADLLASLPKRRRAAARQGTSDGAAAGRPRAGLSPAPGQRLGDLGDLAGHRGRGGRGRGGRRPRAGEWATNAEHTGEILIAPPPAADQVAGPPEGTPIFNQMQTGWFAEEDEKTPQKATQSWTTAADADIAAVTRALAGKPTKVTAAGLPKRVPRAMLVPGTASSPAPAAVVPAEPPAKVAPIARQSAERVRDQFASYQRGVRQARSVGRGW